MYRAKTNTFHLSAAATGSGTDMNVSGIDSISIQIVATASPFQVTFKSSVDQTNFNDIMAVNSGSLAPATTATAAGVYNIDTRGMRIIRVVIDSVAGGYVTAKGFGGYKN